MLLVIDNFDSFTYNLVQYFGRLGIEQRVYRNNALTVDEALALKPSSVLISPGPCTPTEAGISLDVIGAFSSRGVPVLGVCLGHQGIGQYFGGKVIRAPYLMHGKTSEVRHNGAGLFEGMPNPFTVARYHSLIVERDTLPDCLEITAETDDGLIMGLRHKTLPVHGVQFHPESFATDGGIRILENFLKVPA